MSAILKAECRRLQLYARTVGSADLDVTAPSAGLSAAQTRTLPRPSTSSPGTALGVRRCR